MTTQEEQEEDPENQEDFQEANTTNVNEQMTGFNESSGRFEQLQQIETVIEPEYSYNELYEQTLKKDKIDYQFIGNFDNTTDYIYYYIFEKYYRNGISNWLVFIAVLLIVFIFYIEYISEEILRVVKELENNQMALYFNPFNEQYYSQTKSRIQDIYDTVTSNNTTSLTFKYIGCVMIVLTYYFRHSIYRTVSDFYITGRMTWVFFAALSIVSLLIIIFVLVFSSTIEMLFGFSTEFYDFILFYEGYIIKKLDSDKVAYVRDYETVYQDVYYTTDEPEKNSDGTDKGVEVNVTYESGSKTIPILKIDYVNKYVDILTNCPFKDLESTAKTWSRENMSDVLELRAFAESLVISSATLLNLIFFIICVLLLMSARVNIDDIYQEQGYRSALRKVYKMQADKKPIKGIQPKELKNDFKFNFLARD